MQKYLFIIKNWVIFGHEMNWQTKQYLMFWWTDSRDLIHLEDLVFYIVTAELQ